MPGSIDGGTDQRVARVVPFEVRADHKPVGVGRGHVLGGVDGDVDPPGEQRLLDLLHEHAAFADLPERAHAVAVAGGRDRDERELDPGSPERSRRLLGLREREPRAARPDANEHSSTSKHASRGRTTGMRAGLAGMPTARPRAAAARCA